MIPQRVAGPATQRVPAQESGAEGLKSLRKAIRVLECFSLQEPRLPLTDIARKVGLPLSTAHRILTTLRTVGIVEQEGDRDLYRLGLKLLELGSMVLANMEVHREALPCIEELVRETGETVHLGVFDGSQVVSIEEDGLAARPGHLATSRSARARPPTAPASERPSSRINRTVRWNTYVGWDWRNTLDRRSPIRSGCAGNSPRSGPRATPWTTWSTSPTSAAWQSPSAITPAGSLPP